MPTIDEVTQQELRHDISRRLGDMIATGVATATSVSSLTDTKNLLVTTADRLIGARMFLYAGEGYALGADSERYISANTTAGAVSISPNWTTTPDVTTYYEVHRKWRVQEYNTAIHNAIRADAEFHISGPESDMYAITRNALRNGLFTDIDTDGDAEFWTESAATIYAVAAIPPELIGSTVEVKVVIWTIWTTAVKITLSDGTTSDTDTHGGSGWEELTASITVADATLEITLTIEILGGASFATTAKETTIRRRGPCSFKLVSNTGVTMYIDSAYMPHGLPMREYDLNKNFFTVHDVAFGKHETTAPQWEHLNPWEWEVVPGHERVRHVLRLVGDLPTPDRVIRVDGMTLPWLPSSDTSDTGVIGVNIELITQTVMRALIQYRGEWSRAEEVSYWEFRRDQRIMLPDGSRSVGAI